MLRKQALITGATGDIGKVIAADLSKAGYNLLLCGNKGEFDTSQIVTDYSEFRFDISSAEQVRATFKDISKQFGKIDLLVSCAGVAAPEQMLIDMSDDVIDKLISTNLNGTIYANKYALPLLNKGGSIVNISSFLGETGCCCEAAYAAAKAGVINLTKSLAQEFAPFLVRVNSISPGYIDTKMNAEFSSEEKQQIIQQTPLKRLGRPEDISSAVLFLAQNTFITGENITISGGYTI